MEGHEVRPRRKILCIDKADLRTLLATNLATRTLGVDVREGAATINGEPELPRVHFRIRLVSHLRHSNTSTSHTSGQHDQYNRSSRSTSPRPKLSRALAWPGRWRQRQRRTLGRTKEGDKTRKVIVSKRKHDSSPLEPLRNPEALCSLAESKGFGSGYISMA